MVYLRTIPSERERGKFGIPEDNTVGEEGERGGGGVYLRSIPSERERGKFGIPEDNNIREGDLGGVCRLVNLARVILVWNQYADITLVVYITVVLFSS